MFGPTNLKEQGYAEDFSKACDESFQFNSCTKTAKWYVPTDEDVYDSEPYRLWAQDICPAEKFANTMFFVHKHGNIDEGYGAMCIFAMNSILREYNWKRSDDLNFTFESSQCYGFADIGSAESSFQELPAMLKAKGWNSIHVTLTGNQGIGRGTSDGGLCPNQPTRTKFQVCAEYAKGVFPPCPPIGSSCNPSDTSSTSQKLVCADTRGARAELVCDINGTGDPSDDSWKPVDNPGSSADDPYNIES